MAAPTASKKKRSQRKPASLAPVRTPPKEGGLLRIVQPKVHDRWVGLSRRDWTPEAVRQTLDASHYQRLYQLFRLFELMEDTWPRLAKNLHDLKISVTKSEWAVHPFALKGKKPSAKAQEKAEFVEELLFGMRGNAASGQNGWGQTIYDLLDAYGKGVSVLEVDWKRRDDGVIAPEGTRWLRPIHFDYPLYEANADERLLLCASGDLTNYSDFPEHHFLVGIYRTRSAVQATQSGLLRRLAPWWVFGNFAVEWLVNFAQLFGVPLRWATYDPRHADQLATISEMLENMGSAGWGAFPEGTNLNLLDSAKNGTDNPQTAVLDRADKLCDLLILGQTLTSDVGDSGSRALGDVHERVRGDRVQEAAEWVGEVLTNQLVPAIVKLNYGDAEELPWVGPIMDEHKDALAMAQRDKLLFVDMGLPVAKQHLYERHDVPEPGPDEELFEPKAQEPQPGGAPGEGGDGEAFGRMAFGAKNGQRGRGLVKASAHLDDVRLTELPDDTLETVRGFVAVSPRSRLTVPRYSMTAAELIGKADPHNLETARKKVADTEPEKAAEEVRARQDVKHVLLMNDRVIDGHHFIAKAERGGYSAGLRVLDLTPARFQAKDAQAMPQAVVRALAALPAHRRDHFLRKIHQAATVA